MKLTELSLPGAYLITYEPMHDERGYFARSFCASTFKQHGLHHQFLQCNISFNKQKGTVRGMHYQQPPHEEVKIVSCCRGAIFDVIVDLRPQSQTYGQWYGVTLSMDNQQALYVPKGFAHGFQTLVNDSEVHYLMGHEYQPGAAAGLRWDDKRLAIQWPLAVTMISTKDQCLPEFTP